VRQCFEKTRTDLRMALIGDAPYAQDYIRQVRDTTDNRIVMPGAIYGEGYHQLCSHCFAYIHATEEGGAQPALIEAMAGAALVLACFFDLRCFFVLVVVVVVAGAADLSAAGGFVAWAPKDRAAARAVPSSTAVSRFICVFSLYKGRALSPSLQETRDEI